MPSIANSSSAHGDSFGQEASDEILMTRLRDGNDSALARLIERWELPLKSFLLRLGLPSSEVEDLAQDSFVRLYQKRERYRPGAPFKPWLFTLAGNLARNRLRWRWRHRAESLEAISSSLGHAFEGGHDTRDSAPEALEKQERGALVREAIADLPRRLREVIVVVEVEGLSYAEASAVLACSIKAVETRLYRARSFLRERLRDLLDPKTGP